jgi:peptidyl-prolyl cis-trans isomerase SurA
MIRSFLIAACLTWHASPLDAQVRQPLDQVVAIVNTNAILKSDVDQRVLQYLQSSQAGPFTTELWYDVLESMIDTYVLVEKAKIDSVIVTDEEVGRALDTRLQGMISQLGSEQAIEQMFGKSIIQLKAEYREQFREEILADRVRNTQRSKIRISRPEVERFFQSIPQDSLPLIPESVEIAQIVAIPPSKPDAENATFRRAAAIRDSILNHGKDFEAMARLYGEDNTARNGGLLPLMPLSDLVSEFAAAAAALQPGGVSEVVKTAFGYHVIRLNRRVGDQIETNHILLRIRQSELDDDAAISRLSSIRDSILTRQQSFFMMARRHSDDKNTSAFGGRLINPQTGERRLPIEALDPALYRTVLLLEPGQISEPRAFESPQTGSRAYRIIHLIARIPEHKPNLTLDYDLIENYALQSKQLRVMGDWMTTIRSQVHIQYMVPVP